MSSPRQQTDDMLSQGGEDQASDMTMPDDSVDNFDLLFGRETDLVERHFGEIGEGHSADQNTPTDTLSLMRSRWQERRDLLRYAQFPEGFEFFFQVPGHPPRAVVLLTPPRLVAVLRADGTWTRQQREEDVHGPPLYTARIYQEYLTANNLPSWFLTDEHLEMAETNAESDSLAMVNEPSAVIQPPLDYLEHRYRGEVRYLDANAEHDFHVDGNLTTGQASHVSRLARRFPALGLRAAGVEYNIIVRSTGHVVLVSPLAGAEELDDAEYSMRLEDIIWRSEDGYEPIASYCIEDSSTLSTPDEATAEVDRTLQVRQQGAANARAAGAVMNPSRPGRGVGHYAFVTPEDQHLAIRLGIDPNAPREILGFRAAGGFAGLNPDHTPAVAWYPEHRFWNPSRLPTGRGKFVFATVDGEGTDDQAAAYLGGAAQGHGMPDQPSARDIFNLRQRSFFGPDVTEGIGIIWVPEAGTTTVAQPPVRSTVTNPVTNPVTNAMPSQSPASEHDPTNGAEPGNDHDQTAPYPGRQLYYTQEFDGVPVTVDRRRCNVGYLEPHKLHLYGRSGWTYYPHAANIDWHDKDIVEKLNKWRDQNYSRSDWPSLRPEPRQDYTEDEIDWLWELVEELKGGRPGPALEEITKEFNQEFGQKRTVSGVSALFSRLRKQFEGGGRRVRQYRGWWQKKMKEERERKARAEEEEKRKKESGLTRSSRFVLVDKEPARKKATTGDKVGESEAGADGWDAQGEDAAEEDEEE